MPYRPPLVILGTALLCLACARQPTPTSDTELQAVRQVLQQELTAANSGDFQAFMGILSPDAVAMPPNEPAHQGADLEQWLRALFEQFSIQVTETDDELHVTGDWAVHRYSFQWTVTPKAGGSGATERGVGIHVLRKQADGTWKLAWDMWHPTSPPPAPAPPTKG